MAASISPQSGFSAAILRPGDVLLYRGTGVFSWAIRLKTWSNVSHCEGYVGEGRSVASRDGVGVGEYPLRLDGLYAVLRPRRRFCVSYAAQWFATVAGQGYDWIGLLAFFTARMQGNSNKKMFCSEFITRWQRAGRIEPFADSYDADAVSPGMLLASPAYRIVAKVD